MTALISKSQVRRLEKRAINLLKKNGWKVRVGRSPISASIYLYCRRGARVLAIRISDHIPNANMFAKMDVLIHPNGETYEYLVQIVRNISKAP